jgi:hypothetical protein
VEDDEKAVNPFTLVQAVSNPVCLIEYFNFNHNIKRQG